MNDFASQLKQQTDAARHQYESVMQNIQAQAKQYQDSLRIPNMYSQQPIPPQYQPQIPPQVPVFPQQPQEVPQPANDTPPYTLQILAVLGDIKGLLMRAYPDKEPEAAAEAKEEVVDKPVKTPANESSKK